MLHQKIDHIETFLSELDELKKSNLISGKTKLCNDWITLSLTSDLSEAIANHPELRWGKFFSQMTIDELIVLLKVDVEEKKKELEKEKVQ